MEGIPWKIIKKSKDKIQKKKKRYMTNLKDSIADYQKSLKVEE